MLKNTFILISILLLLSTGCKENQAPVTDKALEETKKDHEHNHSHTPHHGIETKLYSDQKPAGIAELKLHDDKGDLELWLTNTDENHSSFDLPLDTKITVSFSGMDGKEVTLQVRNTEKNEDEDGNGNIREGKTNYFIFPGDTGVDSTFLVGKDFSAEVQIKFSHNDKEYMSKIFKLVPHVH